MRFAGLLVLAAFAFAYVYSEENNDRGDLSDGDKPILFSQLPSDVKSDFFKIVSGSANALGGSCLGIEPNYDKVELLLYHDNPESFTKLDPNLPVGIDLTAPLYILSHGWLSGLNGYKIKSFRDKYIEVYKKNILFVNWGKLAWYPYPTASCNIPFIGQFVAKLLCTLHEKHNFDLGQVHMIGHSLGGQLSGFTGKGVQKQCNQKMGKITALDPAGPLFQLKKEDARLSPTDAEFVEVVHSNAGMFGYMGKAGDVDYHLNCGTLQPGCIIPKDFSKIAETSIYMFACPHMRSVELWPYVLQSKNFKAKSCKLCGGLMPGTCLPDAFGARYVSLGYNYKKSTNDQFNIITGPYSPFSMGCSAFPLQGCL